MTLIVASFNQDYAVIAADTRLSSNGRLVDDNSTKVGLIRCRGGRLIYAYTGLARRGRFETRGWLIDSILEIWKPWSTVDEGLASLTRKATKDFSSLPTLKNSPEKRLAVVFAGYVDGAQVIAQISNFDDPLEEEICNAAKNEFSLYQLRINGPEPIVGVFARGIVPLAFEPSKQKLHQLVQKRKPLRAIQGLAEAIIVAAAKDTETARTVGQTILMAAMLADPDTNIITSYLPPHAHDEVHLADVVDVIDHIGVEGPGAKMEPPLVGRQKYKAGPCNCGSGLRFKKCHGRKRWNVHPDFGMGFRAKR